VIAAPAHPDILADSASRVITLLASAANFWRLPIDSMVSPTHASARIAQDGRSEAEWPARVEALIANIAAIICSVSTALDAAAAAKSLGMMPFNAAHCCRGIR